MSNITLNGTLNVDCGKGIMFAVELHRIHESVVAHVLLRGLKPCLQDCHASITLESCGGDEKKMRDDSAAAVGKYVEGLYAGTVRVRGVTRETTADPMSRFRIEALREIVNGKDSKAWAKLSKREDKGEVIKAMLTKFAETIEPRAMELKAEDDAKKVKAAEIAGKMDLSEFGL